MIINKKGLTLILNGGTLKKGQISNISWDYYNGIIGNAMLEVNREDGEILECLNTSVPVHDISR